MVRLARYNWYHINSSALGERKNYIAMDEYSGLGHGTNKFALGVKRRNLDAVASRLRDHSPLNCGRFSGRPDKLIMNM